MPENIPALMYHRICDDREWYESEFVVTRSTFEKQMGYLADHGYYTPPLDELLNGNHKPASGKRPVILTFDDGYLDNYENALPIMRAFGFTGIIFAVADFTRRTNWWDTGNNIPQTRLLEPEHIAALDSEGIQIGSHTFSHRPLPDLSDNELKDEVTRSKELLEEILRRPINCIAYPYGLVDERVKSATLSAGYSYAFATNSGPFFFHSDLYQIRRVTVGNTASRSYLFAKLSGADRLYRWLRWKARGLLLRKS